MEAIPIMDDPLGKYWNQPKDIREAPMDEKYVLLTPEQISGLMEYSTTLPSGVYPGKCWKRIQQNETFLAWYGEESDGKCPILFRTILEVQTEEPDVGGERI